MNRHDWGGPKAEAKMWKDIEGSIRLFTKKFDWQFRATRLSALNIRCENNCEIDHPCLEIEPRPFPWDGETSTFYLCGEELIEDLYMHGNEHVAGQPGSGEGIPDVRMFSGDSVSRAKTILTVYISSTLKRRHNQMSKEHFDDVWSKLSDAADEVVLHAIEQAQDFLKKPIWSRVSVSETTYPTFMNFERESAEELMRVSLAKAGYTTKWPHKMAETQLLVLGSDDLTDDDLAFIGFHIWIKKQPITNEDTFRKGLTK